MADHDSDHDQHQRLPWRKHYPGDWAMEIGELELAEQAVFIQMLDLQWAYGPLPNDPARLARQVRGGATKKLISTVFERKFTKTSDGWTNVELERRRQEVEAEKAKRSKAGKVAAEARWRGKGDADRNADRNASRMPDQRSEIRGQKDLPVLEGEDADQPHIRALEGGKK